MSARGFYCVSLISAFPPFMPSSHQSREGPKILQFYNADTINEVAVLLLVFSLQF